MPPCTPKVSEFAVWFASVPDETQREVLVMLRKRAADLGVTVTYTHLTAVEDTFTAEDALDLFTGRPPQLSLN